MIKPDLPNDLRLNIEDAVRRAGEILLSQAKAGFSINKKDGGDIVTDVDLMSEKSLIKDLSPVLPGAGVIGEESGERPSENGYKWVIDPLDGTLNYCRGIPAFCISVALTFNDKPVAGCVYHPPTDEMFYAELGQGLMVNGSLFKKPEACGKRLLISGYGFKRGPGTFVSKRKLGAWALDLAYIAAGRLDAGFFPRFNWWDIAAGILLVQEGGGVIVTEDESGACKQFPPFWVASRESVYQELKPFNLGKRLVL